MLVSNVRRLREALGLRRSLLPSLFVGLGIWIGFPTVVAYQDMVSLVSRQEVDSRWTAVIEPAVAGSVHKAEMPFANPDVGEGSLSGAGLAAPGIGEVAFRGHKKAGGFTDESTINRAEKKGRLVKTLPMAPPRLFNAGSILERTGALLEPAPLGDVLMAFVKPEIEGREIQIARSFYIRKNKPAGSALPSAIAALVNNEEADVLAAAYAPVEPDYAKDSPFASILRGENDGRFIPPVPPTDHAWGRRPLPPDVFTDREQQCLAAGIYFEARGEPVRGQAAVAQVILNRVRNPTYPNTICGVVYQNEKWRNRCQFSFACDGIRDRVASPGHFRTAKEVGIAVTAGKIWLEEVGTSTHYHATYVHPRWARAMKRMKKIGRHVFYRTYGGGWN